MASNPYLTNACGIVRYTGCASWASAFASGAIADVVCRHYRNRNEYLAFAVTPSQIGDPEVQIIKLCFKMARTCMFFPTCSKICQMTPRLLQDLLDVLKSLKRWIHRLGWSITGTGSIHTERNLILSLIYTDPVFVEQQTDHAWSLVVRREIKHSKGMQNVPDVNSSMAVKTLDRLEDADIGTITMYLSGAFTHQDQAKHWQDHDGKCLFCKTEDDSQFHRILQCQSFHEVRQSFFPTVDWLREQCPFWTATPLIPARELEDTWLQICALYPFNPDVPGTHDHPGYVARFFTDGNCTASVSAWSVIQDVSAESDRSSIAKPVPISHHVSS